MKYYHRIETIHNTYDADRIVDRGYYIEELPINKPVWAFAYDVNDDTEHRRLSCIPVLGEIKLRASGGHYYYSSFYPYKNGTHAIRKSGKVQYNSRYYADTYEEAVEMYNELVQRRIDNLKRMIDDAEKDKIVVSNEGE